MLAPNALNNSTNDDLADLGLATLVPDDQLNDGDQVSARTRPLATARQSGESRAPSRWSALVAVRAIWLMVMNERRGQAGSVSDKIHGWR